MALNKPVQVMTIVDIGYIQSFGSFCNAVGALAIGQVNFESFLFVVFVLELKFLFQERLEKVIKPICLKGTAMKNLHPPIKLLFQMADTTGPKTMFLFSTIIVSIYYSLISFARCWYSFFFLQVIHFLMHILFWCTHKVFSLIYYFSKTEKGNKQKQQMRT